MCRNYLEWRFFFIYWMLPMVQFPCQVLYVCYLFLTSTLQGRCYDPILNKRKLRAEIRVLRADKGFEPKRMFVSVMDGPPEWTQLPSALCSILFIASGTLSTLMLENTSCCWAGQTPPSKSAASKWSGNVLAESTVREPSPETKYLFGNSMTKIDECSEADDSYDFFP